MPSHIAKVALSSAKLQAIPGGWPQKSNAVSEGMKSKLKRTLRGSSEFHAWGDSNLYLRRDGDDLSLSVEHRAAPSMTPITIELAQRGTALALEVVDRRDPATPPPSSLDERITATLAGADAALPFAELRACCRVRATTLYERLAVLADTGRVVKTDDGYRLADG